MGLNHSKDALQLENVEEHPQYPHRLLSTFAALKELLNPFYIRLTIQQSGVLDFSLSRAFFQVGAIASEQVTALAVKKRRECDDALSHNPSFPTSLDHPAS